MSDCDDNSLFHTEVETWDRCNLAMTRWQYEVLEGAMTEGVYYGIYYLFFACFDIFLSPQTV